MLFQSDLNKAEIYEQLIKSIDSTRLSVKLLKSFYRENKKEGKNLETIDQWTTMKQNVERSLVELEEFFNQPNVLHSDVQWKIPYDVVHKYLDNFENIDRYLEDQLVQVNLAMENLKIKSDNFSRFSALLRKATQNQYANKNGKES